MGASSKTWVNNTAPTCDADDLNNFNNEINNAIEDSGQGLDFDNAGQLSVAINKKGVKRYNEDTSYSQYDLVRDTTGYKLYGSIIDANEDNALTDSASWRYLGDLRELGIDLVASISALAIDWSEARVFKKFIAADSTFTFANMVNKTITVVITDTDTKTATFPDYVIWDGDAAPSQTALKTDIYEFKYVDGDVYGKQIYSDMTGGWPYGVLGDLTIGAAETVELAAGEVYDYDNITIAATGKLKFTGSTTDWTILAAKTNITVTGTIECKDSTVVGVSATTTPDNVDVTGTTVQAAGGAGGAGGNGGGGAAAGGAGNAAGNGGGGGGGGGAVTTGGTGNTNGGGGGGGAESNASSNGGNGDIGGGGGGSYRFSPTLVSVGGNASGINGGAGGVPFGGAGGSSYGANGGDATGSSGNYAGTGGGARGTNGGAGGHAGDHLGTHGFFTGGGGGGGSGLHGKNLYIRCGGTFDGTSGTIDVSGHAGGAGGRGGTGTGTAVTSSGGGGGGAAGGSAGKIYIRHAGAGVYTAPTLTVTAGAAGAAGAAGTPKAGGTSGSAGTAGTAGNAGSSDVAEYGV